MNRRAAILAFAAVCAVVLIAGTGCQKSEQAAPAPVVASVEPMPRDELVAYLVRQTSKAERSDAGETKRLEANRASYHGCIEKNKEDDCRFMLCSPYAIYAGDEYFQLGNLDDAFVYYTAAFNLLKEEVANSEERRNQREEDFAAKQADNSATEQDRRHYLYRRLVLTQNLFRNYAEIARILERFAIVFTKQGKTAEAENARSTADAFLRQSADEYEGYYRVRTELLPMLDPTDKEKGVGYLAVVKDLDGLMEVRHF